MNICDDAHYEHPAAIYPIILRKTDRKLIAQYHLQINNIKGFPTAMTENISFINTFSL